MGKIQMSDYMGVICRYIEMNDVNTQSRLW
jgi:hypothetical protein